MAAFADTLGSLAETLFRLSAVAFLLVNGAAAGAFALSVDRRGLVNRWTARLVAANLLLLGTGLAVPSVAGAVKLVAEAVSSRPAVLPRRSAALDR